MTSAPAPEFFFALPVLLFVVVVWWLLRERAALRADLGLSVPAGVTPGARGPDASPRPCGPGPRRDGQTLTRADAQERAARVALRPRLGRVDAAPVRCPLDRVDE